MLGRSGKSLINWKLRSIPRQRQLETISNGYDGSDIRVRWKHTYLLISGSVRESFLSCFPYSGWSFSFVADKLAFSFLFSFFFCPEVVRLYWVCVSLGRIAYTHSFMYYYPLCNSQTMKSHWTPSWEPPSHVRLSHDAPQISKTISYPSRLHYSPHSAR